VGTIRESPRQTAAAMGTSPLQRRRQAVLWAATALAAAGFILAGFFAVAYFRATGVSVRPVRSYILPPEKTTFQFVAATGGPVLSPDGTRLVFPARDSSGKELLWVRPLDSLSGQRLEGTEGASFPFWSPDSRLLGFFVPGKLKKIDVLGGPPQTICDASSGRGGTWNADGVIVFAPEPTSPLWRVSAAGGAPSPLTQLDKSRQTSHRWPVFLPDGRHLLYWAGNPLSAAGVGSSGVYLGSLDGKDHGFLMPADSEALYAPPGFLLFQREQSLMAQAFDAGSPKLTGDAFPIAEQVANPANFRLGFFSVSTNGVLVYLAGSAAQDRIAWLDASGKESAAVGEPGSLGRLRLSPDGSRLAEDVLDSQSRNVNLWVVELARGVRTRFTFGQADFFPVWSPDGSRIAFASNRKGTNDIYIKDASGAGTEEPLLESEAAKNPTDWSRDGRFIAFNQFDPKRAGRAGSSIWILPLFGDRKPFPFLQTEFNTASAVFSPDGHWVAYQSDESGKFEIYVAPFQPPAAPQVPLSLPTQAGQGVGGAGGKWQVSQGGGRIPTWRRDGKGLYYFAPEGKLMEAAVTPKGSAVAVGMPHELFQAHLDVIGPYARVYDVAPNGQRFLVLMPQESAAVPLTLVTNWTAGLKK
jgi:eukaryotic-like serine/threonine-protein kinase